MFTKLSLKNFKAWRDVESVDEAGPSRRVEIEITLAPVTMLLGTNSSGKSSLLQALLLLKQTALLQIAAFTLIWAVTRPMTTSISGTLTMC